MANSPATDIATLLANDGHGTKGEDLFVSREPDTNSTLTTTVYDTGGERAAEPKWALDYPTVQVRVRGVRRDYDGAWGQAEAVKQSLHSRPTETVSSVAYYGIWTVGDIIFLTYDDSECPVVVVNFRMIREHTTTTGHRQPIP
jgi:hypothetical protein